MLLLAKLIKSAERVSVSRGFAAKAALEGFKVRLSLKELRKICQNLQSKPFSTTVATADSLGPSAGQQVSLTALQQLELAMSGSTPIFWLNDGMHAMQGNLRARAITSFRKGMVLDFML